MTVHDASTPAKPRRKGAGSTEVLLAEIVKGHTVATAAKTAGMSDVTARRRLKEPETAAKLAELRTSALSTTADRLAALSHGAAVVLGEIANDRDAPAGVRVQAANSILGHQRPIREAAVVEERLAAIEQAVEAQQRLRSVAS